MMNERCVINIERDFANQGKCFRDSCNQKSLDFATRPRNGSSVRRPMLASTPRLCNSSTTR